MDYLYLISCGSKVHKIGISEAPSRRMKALQTSHPTDLLLVKTWRLIDPRKVERRTHTILKPHKLRGEWFSVTEGEAINAIRSAIHDHSVGKPLPQHVFLQDAAHEGGRQTKAKFAKQNKARFAKIADRWGDPTWPTATLLAEAGDDAGLPMSRNTANKYAGMTRERAVKLNEARLKRAQRKEQSDAR